MVVVPEPAVKGFGAFAAVAVDRSVGPAAEHRADEAFCFAVGLGPVGARAEVSDPLGSARDRVQSRAVGGAVVGQQSLDMDAVTLVEADGSAQECDHRRGLLVAEDFGVGQPGRVIDRDVHELPAKAVARAVIALLGASLRAKDAVPGTGDPAELLDVNVDQLAWAGTLVASGRLHPEPAELAHPDPSEDP